MTSVQRLIEEIAVQFSTLNLSPSSLEIEKMAFLVYRSYNSGTRKYHDMDHVFEVCRSDNPLIYFAGLFHDIVYVQVDNGINEEIEKIICSKIFQKNSAFFCIAENLSTLDNAVFKIFGQVPSENALNSKGINELLSALVAVEFLGKWLTQKDGLVIACLIEATIPFRAQNESFDWTVQSEKRFSEACDTIGFPATEKEVENTLGLAVEMSNRDVAGFGAENPDSFLNGTWQLLPETNHLIRESLTYSMAPYREALQKMLEFLTDLETKNVFHFYRNKVSKEQITGLSYNVTKNIEVSRQYLQIKMITALLFELVANETGGDGPVSYFVGEVPTPGHPRRGLENYLPTDVVREPQSKLEKLLVNGRSANVGHDLKNAPIASFIYYSCGFQKCIQIFHLGLETILGKASAMDYLKSFPPKTMLAFLEALKKMVPARIQQIDELKKRLQLMDSRDVA